MRQQVFLGIGIAILVLGSFFAGRHTAPQRRATPNEIALQALLTALKEEYRYAYRPWLIAMQARLLLSSQEENERLAGEQLLRVLVDRDFSERLGDALLGVPPEYQQRLFEEVVAPTFFDDCLRYRPYDRFPNEFMVDMTQVYRKLIPRYEGKPHLQAVLAVRLLYYDSSEGIESLRKAVQSVEDSSSLWRLYDRLPLNAEIFKEKGWPGIRGDLLQKAVAVFGNDWSELSRFADAVGRHDAELASDLRAKAQELQAQQGGGP